MGGFIRRDNREEGATLVEFAFIMPLLLLLIFGIIETGRLLTTFISVSTASREGARYATATGDGSVAGEPRYIDCEGIKDHALQRVFVGGLDSDDITVTWDEGPGTDEFADCEDDIDTTVNEPAASDITSGDRVNVTVQTTFDAIVPIISNFYDGINIESTDSRTIFKGVLSG